MEHFEHCIIGAGVIGLAIAYKLSLLRPKDKILLIESHSQFGSETSSRNSEVIHAGIYYPEKSLKTQLCQQGKVQLYDFCEQFSVPHKRIGKLIIANNESDIQTLEDIQLNAQKSNTELTLLNQKECLKLEPHINAKAALYSSTTGIIDSHSYMQTLLMLSQQQGVLFSPHTHFLAAKKKAKGFRVILDTQDGEYSISCSKLINSSGLHAPTVATNIDTLDKSLIPQYHYCRGHYYSYQGKSPFSHLIYPVPNQQISGLGIHATLDLAGQVRFGPDTQFISKIDYNVHDQDEALRAEVFLKAIRQYFPAITADKLHLSYSGIRPKLSAENEAAKDFMIQTEKDHNVVGLMNLFGIESPGLTASLAIADQVCSLQ